MYVSKIQNCLLLSDDPLKHKVVFLTRKYPIPADDDLVDDTHVLSTLTDELNRGSLVIPTLSSVFFCPQRKQYSTEFVRA